MWINQVAVALFAKYMKAC